MKVTLLFLATSFCVPLTLVAQEAPAGAAAPSVSAPAQPVDAPPAITNKLPRIFLQSASKGNNRNAARDQSSEMAKDFERDCPDVKITINQAKADYTVSLNHIEVGAFIRDNQFEIYDADGDRMKGKEGGSIRNGIKDVCALINRDFAAKLATPAPVTQITTATK